MQVNEGGAKVTSHEANFIAVMGIDLVAAGVKEFFEGVAHIVEVGGVAVELGVPGGFVHLVVGGIASEAVGDVEVVQDEFAGDVLGLVGGVVVASVIADCGGVLDDGQVVEGGEEVAKEGAVGFGDEPAVEELLTGSGVCGAGGLLGLASFGEDGGLEGVEGVTGDDLKGGDYFVTGWAAGLSVGAVEEVEGEGGGEDFLLQSFPHVVAGLRDEVETHHGQVAGVVNTESHGDMVEEDSLGAWIFGGIFLRDVIPQGGMGGEDGEFRVVEEGDLIGYDFVLGGVLVGIEEAEAHGRFFSRLGSEEVSTTEADLDGFSVEGVDAAVVEVGGGRGSVPGGGEGLERGDKATVSFGPLPVGGVHFAEGPCGTGGSLGGS